VQPHPRVTQIVTGMHFAQHRSTRFSVALGFFCDVPATGDERRGFCLLLRQARLNNSLL
jgi:hypothetical protein